MKDIYGNKIEVGDRVAYASSSGACELNLGEVIGYCKNGVDAVRVRVDISSRYTFRNGLKRYRYANGSSVRVNTVVRLPGESYVTTVRVSQNIARVEKAT